MPITRDEEFPVEAAQLMAAFNRCADDQPFRTVFEASAQMFIACMVAGAKVQKIPDDEVDAYWAAIIEKVMVGIRLNWNRKAEPGDIPVRPN